MFRTLIVLLVLVSTTFGQFGLSGNAGSWVRLGNDVFLSIIGDSVGIGTASPSQKLEVVGGIRATFVAADSGDFTVVVIDTAVISADSSTSSLVILPAQGSTKNPLWVGDSTSAGDGVPAMIVKPNGYVGIGTASPTSGLTINAGSGTLVNGLTFQDGSTGIYNDAANGNLTLESTSMEIHATTLYGTNTGKFGILANANVTNTTPVFLTKSTDTNTGLGGTGDDTLSFVAGGVSGMVLAESGGSVTVGIGTTTPTHPLHVWGQSIAIGDTAAGDNDVTINFATDGAIAGEYLKWDDGASNFVISDDLVLGTAANWVGKSSSQSNIQFQTGGIATGIVQFEAWNSIGSSNAKEAFSFQEATFTAGAGANNHYFMNNEYTANFAGAQTGDLFGYYLNATETDLQGADHFLFSLNVGGSNKFQVNNDGDVTVAGDLTVTGTINEVTATHLGEMTMYEESQTVTINTANVYHLIYGFNEGDLESFTFDAGRVVDANIVSEADSTQLGIETSANHGLTTGDIVGISGANNAAHNGVTPVVVLSDTTFTCDSLTYTANAGASSAVVDEGSYLQASAGAAGKYLCNINMSGTAALASKVYKLEVFKNAEEQNNIVMEYQPPNSRIQGPAASGFLDVAVGDRIFMAIKGKTDATNFVGEHSNLNLHKL